MGEKDKKALERANEELLQRRENFTSQNPGQNGDAKLLGSISPIIGGNEIRTYLDAVRAGEKVTESHVIEGNLERWKAFDWTRHEDLSDAKRRIVDWSKTRVDGGGMIIAGDCGCGKSHIARAIADARGPLAVFVNEIDLVKKIQATYNNRNATEESVILRYKSAPLLIYDDLGTYLTDNLQWLQNIYYTLFNDRKDQNKATIVTTNLPLSDHSGRSPLEEWMGVRQFSRLIEQVELMEYYIDLFNVPDYRLRNFT